MSLKAVAYDSFTEASDTALGSHSAEIGGTNWVTGGGTFTVKGGLGYVQITGANETATLTGASFYNGFALAVAGTTNTAGAGPTVRNIISGATWNQHLYLIYLQPIAAQNGKFDSFKLFRRTAGSFTLITTYTKALTSPVTVKFLASGSSATTLRAKAWGNSEPDAWEIDTTDNTAANQTSAIAPVGIYLEPSGYVSDLLGQTNGPGPARVTQAVTRSAVF